MATTTPETDPQAYGPQNQPNFAIARQDTKRILNFMRCLSKADEIFAEAQGQQDGYYRKNLEVRAEHLKTAGIPGLTEQHIELGAQIEQLTRELEILDTQAFATRRRQAQELESDAEEAKSELELVLAGKRTELQQLNSDISALKASLKAFADGEPLLPSETPADGD